MKKYLLVILLAAAQFCFFDTSFADDSLGKETSSQDHLWNIRTQPLSLVLGIINAQVDYAISDNITIGPNFSSGSMSLLNYNVSVSGFGIEANYYFNQVFNDGWYLNGGYGSTSASVKYNSSIFGDIEGKATAAGIVIGGGYHWFWENFNLNLGLTTLLSSTVKVELKDSTGTTQDSYSYTSGAGLAFAMGYAF